MIDSRIRAVEALSKVCRARPSVVQDGHARKGVGLYRWNTGPVQEVHIPETRELILSVHLGGSRRVRVFTEQGLSRSVSKPGDITLFPHGRPVSFRTEGDVDFATVHFRLEALARLDSDPLSRMLNLHTCLFARRDEYVVTSVRTLMRAALAPSRDSVRYFSKLLDSLTCHLAQVVKEGGAEQIVLSTRAQNGFREPNFELVLQHIEAQLSEKLSLDELAECAGVGRALFAREFTARFNCPPHRFVNQRRIERAKSLLFHNDRSIADIAYEVGFSGHSHFSTVFRAFEGCTPKAYVNLAQQSITAGTRVRLQANR